MGVFHSSSVFLRGSGVAWERRQFLPLLALLNPSFAFFITQKASGLEDSLFAEGHEQQLTSFPLILIFIFTNQ